ncbi:MAG: PriCT-2 domain-containing protein [Dechloromonas sp.]|jgi:hypothetical protein|nr:PriCT-2 domain-containing protein [Candidatus Dechloromonas phosphoritropha]
MKNFQQKRPYCDMGKLTSLVYQINADSEYGTWITVLMVIFNETDGSDEGFELADRWSSEGYEKYKGTKDVWAHWRHIKPDHPNPARLGSLIRLVKQRCR